MILLKSQARSWLQHVLTVLGDLMKNFTESLAMDREKRRQVLVDARASRSEEVPLIANQSEARFRLEANVMVRICNSASGTVCQSSLTLRPYQLTRYWYCRITNRCHIA